MVPHECDQEKKATISLIRSETFSLVAEELISILLQNVDRIKKNRALHRAQTWPRYHGNSQALWVRKGKGKHCLKISCNISMGISGIAIPLLKVGQNAEA